MREQAMSILKYLENSYVGACTMDDVELMIRLSRAIVAFKYDIDKDMPGHEELTAWEIKQSESGGET